MGLVIASWLFCSIVGAGSTAILFLVLRNKKLDKLHTQLSENKERHYDLRETVSAVAAHMERDTAISPLAIQLRAALNRSRIEE